MIYSYSNNIVRFERDTPYTVTYNVDFLIENEVWNTIETALNGIIMLGNNNLSTTSPNMSEGTDGTDVPDMMIDEPKIIINKPASTITSTFISFI